MYYLKIGLQYVFQMYIVFFLLDRWTDLGCTSVVHIIDRKPSGIWLSKEHERYILLCNNPILSDSCIDFLKQLEKIDMT